MHNTDMHVTDMDIIAGKLFGVIGKVEHAARKPCRCMDSGQFCSQYALYFTSISRLAHRQLCSAR